MFEFRPFTTEDLPQMLEWLLKPHVREWWDDGEDTLEKVAQNYGEEEIGLGRYILTQTTANSIKPIGYFQHYELPDGTIGIDQFIGDENYLNRGVGTEAIRLFLEKIWQTCAPTTIVLDPVPENKRAIRCYEKVGFKHYITTENDDGSVAYMMRLIRPQ